MPTLLIATLAFMIAGGQVEAPATAPLVCDRANGLIKRPLVPDAETARAIFLAVEKAISPNANWSSDDVVAADDHGDRWVVMRTKDPASIQPGMKMVGGGGLSFEIQKCDGTMSRPAFMR